jgi:hypothetical protein
MKNRLGNKPFTFTKLDGSIHSLTKEDYNALMKRFEDHIQVKPLEVEVIQKRL